VLDENVQIIEEQAVEIKLLYRASSLYINKLNRRQKDDKTKNNQKSIT